MTRKTLLTFTALVAAVVGSFALLAPGVLLASVKHAAPTDSARVMARTVGVLLLSVGVLDLLVRDHEDSKTMRAILAANLVLQIAILPIDPLAYFDGAYRGLGSFLPNTILHLGLAAAYAIALVRAGVRGRSRRTRPA